MVGKCREGFAWQAKDTHGPLIFSPFSFRSNGKSPVELLPLPCMRCSHAFNSEERHQALQEGEIVADFQAPKTLILWKALLLYAALLCCIASKSCANGP